MIEAPLLLSVLGAGIGVGWLAYWVGRRPTSPIPGERTTWRLILPREARFGLAEAAAWFAALAPRLIREEPSLAVELRSEGGQVELELSAPHALEPALRGQLAAWFPGGRLEVQELGGRGGLAVLPLRLAKADLYPLKLPQTREPDPLLGVLGTLTQHAGAAGVRLLVGPPPPDWPRWAPLALQAAQAGRWPPPRGGWLRLYQAYEFLQAGLRPGASAPQSGAAMSPALAGAAVKARATVFTTSIFAWTSGRSRREAMQRAGELGAQLETSFRDPLGNSLAAAGEPRIAASLGEADVLPLPRITLSAAELAALFHLPGPEHPLVTGETSRRVAPPVALLQPVQAGEEPITRLGEALTPKGTVPFGLGLADRRLHTYVVGKTGTGKSTLLATILGQDLAADRGVGLIDPHGDLAERVLALVPPERSDQVLYFNPADTEFPVGFNLLAATTPGERPLVASGVVAVFKKLYPEFWRPRLEYILRNAVLALLETPQPSLLALPRLLTDRAFRTHVLAHVHDPLLRSFFREEFESHDPRWRAEAIAPILNKVGQFLASPVVRHVVGQSQPGFSLRTLMDRGGIVIANLATGRIGEDNAALLGGLLVVGFQLAAMRRADQPEEERQDFFLVVDEFQHFANEAFAVILSEARKYRLSLTLSHQYLGQLPPAMADAVLGNVGNLGIFRVGAPDTTRVVRELAPAFDAQDLVHLPNFHFCARLTRRGETLPAFSARTLPLAPAADDGQALIAHSRRRWAHPRAAVELEIADCWEGRV